MSDRRCQTGDEHAFAQLMTEFSGRTLRYLRSMVGGAADDVQQELWLGVYRNLSTLANPGAFRTWLFRATRLRAPDFLRRRHRERELIAEWPAALTEPAGPVPEDERMVLASSVLAALDSLPPAQREVLQLRYLDEMSYSESAVIVGVSVGTVRSRLHYASQRLRNSD
jgi:RNA polymerase sigma-70 factor (ECF subfamily)